MKAERKDRMETDRQPGKMRDGKDIFKLTSFNKESRCVSQSDLNSLQPMEEEEEVGGGGGGRSLHFLLLLDPI